MAVTTPIDDAADLVRAGWSPPSSPAEGVGAVAVILVVTPTFNSERFLDDTILSVVSQSGDFILRYHLQDGGSTDATLTIIRRWERLLRSGDFPILCAGVVFSFDSSADVGMYQAINRGVAHARPGQPFVMGWINSDDRLAPGALAAVNGIYDQFPEVSFTCARVSMIDQHGVIMGVNLPVVYDRRKLGEGAHDGRSHSFVMQEGTFWRSALWDQVGGLDERFRLAGDWDLWRRFAHHAALFTIDSVLGFHRRHDQQLSADLKRYHAEIDAVHQPSSAATLAAMNEVSETLKFNLANQRWERKRRSTRPAAPIVHHEREGATTARRVEVTSGARFPEGPYPETNLPGGMRWIDDARAEAVVTVPYPGLWRMHLRIRVWRPDLRLRILRGTTVCLEVMPGAGEDHSDTLLFAAVWLEGGRNTIWLESEADGATAGWMFVLLEWYVLAPVATTPTLLAAPERDGERTDTGRWPAIAIVLYAGDRGRLDLRLDAILAQGYPVDLCVVVDDRSNVNRQILAAYAPFVDRVVPLEPDRHVAIGRAIGRSRGSLIAVLDDTMTLAPGALLALADALRRDERIDLVVGITVDEVGSTPIARGMPLLADERLSLPELLRIGLQPDGAAIIGRGALLFTRRIWQAAGGQLLGAPFDGAAFDFWVRCAKVGAVLRTLPVDLTRRASDGDRDGTHRAVGEDVRRHAEAIARDNGLAFGRETSVTRSVLKIVMLDTAGIADRPSDACRRLATVLAAANQRVVCLVDDGAPDGDGQSRGAASVFDAVTSERPDLVVVVGDEIGEAGRDLVTQLVAGNIATINVRTRGAGSGNPTALPGGDPVQMAAADRGGSLGDEAVAALYGILVYGQHGTGAGPEDTPGHRGRILQGLRAGVDPSVYRPDRRRQARQILDWPADAFIVLAVVDPADGPPSRLAVLLQAYAELACDAKLLTVVGYGGERPSVDAPVRWVDDQDADDVAALSYAAADVVVSLRGDDIEMPLVQAAMSGTPTIVHDEDHGGDPIREGAFGLRLSAWTTPLLVAGLQRLAADETVHRALSRSALAYARANHSLEAGASSFMTLVRRLPGFRRLHLAPELHFPVRSPPVSLRPLHTARARPLLGPGWQVAHAPTWLHDAAATAGHGRDIDPADKATLYVRARHGGPQRLRICAASRDGTLVVVVGINGEERARLEFGAADDDGEPQFLHADFFRGLNRVDFALAAAGPSTAGLMLHALDLDVVIDVDAPPRSWQPLIGFIEVDPIDGGGAPSRWLDGPSATLRLWSDAAGSQYLRLVLKNYSAPQLVDVALNGATIRVIEAPTTDFLTATEVFIEVTAQAGWNLISLTTLSPSISGFGRHLRMLVADVCLAALDDSRLLDEEGVSPSTPS